MTGADPYATKRCPVGGICETCGASPTVDQPDPGLAAATAETAMGVLCLTLCRRCADSGMTPRLPAGTAVRFVAAHCRHLGITVDDMAEAMEAGR